MSCLCQQCNNQYTVDILVSDELWEQIKPKNKPKGAGMLCGSCIMSNIEMISDYASYILRINK